MVADDEDKFRGLVPCFYSCRFSGVDRWVFFQGLVQPWPGRARRRRQRREEEWFEASHHGVESNVAWYARWLRQSDTPINDGPLA